MRPGEYGILFYLGTGFNLSSFTSLSITFTRPDGSQWTSSAVTISSSPVTTSAGTFAGNTYGIYTFGATDINQIGNYTAQLTYIDSVQKLISAAVSFTVTS